MYVIRTNASFYQLHILVLTKRPQYFPDFLPDLFEEDFPTKFRDEYDMITTIPAGVEQTMCTHEQRPPLLENWLVNSECANMTLRSSPFPE